MSPRGQQASLSFGVPPVTRGVKWLGIATLVVSVGAALGETGREIAAELTLVPALLAHLQVWRLFTYTFLCPQPINLIFSLLGLWLIGASLEQQWGTRRFVLFYFFTGALAGLATFAVGFVAPSVMGFPYMYNWAPLEAMIAAIAILTPDATFFLYIIPVPARWMLPISAGITLLYMLMDSWQSGLPALFALWAGILLAGGASPRRFWLRARMAMIERRLKRSNLRIVRGLGDEKRIRGSDKYLH
jgi:membrane associated rhomboid family serine protease